MNRRAGRRETWSSPNVVVNLDRLIDSSFAVSPRRVFVTGKNH